MPFKSRDREGAEAPLVATYNDEGTRSARLSLQRAPQTEPRPLGSGLQNLGSGLQTRCDSSKAEARLLPQNLRLPLLRLSHQRRITVKYPRARVPSQHRIIVGRRP